MASVLIVEIWVQNYKKEPGIGIEIRQATVQPENILRDVHTSQLVMCWPNMAEALGRLPATTITWGAGTRTCNPSSVAWQQERSWPSWAARDRIPKQQMLLKLN